MFLSDRRFQKVVFPPAECTCVFADRDVHQFYISQQRDKTCAQQESHHKYILQFSEQREHTAL